MPSVAHRKWAGQGMKALSDVRDAHAAVRRAGARQRAAAQQITCAFAVLLTARFQGCCRDLHTEATDALASVVRPTELGTLLRAQLMTARTLDRGNPTAGNIGADFDRLGMEFWPAVYRHDSRNARRREKLDVLAVWRNAISHDDFAAGGLAGTQLSIDVVESWVGALHGLTLSFDVVVSDQAPGVVGSRPW